MKILHIIDNWGLGGAQRALSNWVKYDTENEHQIIALFEHGAMEWGGYEVTFLGKSYRNLLGIIGRLRREIANRKPNVIMIHLDGARFIHAFAQFGKKRTYKVIWVEQSGDKLKQHYGNMLGTSLRKYQSYLSKKVDYVVAVSDNIKILCDSLFSTNVVKIFNPVDIDKILLESKIPIVNPPSGLDPSKNIVGFIGRLEEVKGIEDLAKIIPLIAENNPDTQFWIVGDGKKRKYLEEQLRKEKHLEGKVVFWGLRKDVFAIMNKIKVILMPSFAETFGLVAAEGFTLNVPVVGYNIDGLQEVLDSSPLGHQVPFGDIHRMADVVSKLLKEPSYKSIQNKNIFDAKVIAKKYNSLFL